MDADNLRAQIAAFGVDAVLTPKTQPSPNAAFVADETREATDIRGIRAEPSARVELSDNGVGRQRGSFNIGVNAQQAQLCVCRADVAIAIRPGDEISYPDRPGLRYRISKKKPDGLAGVVLVLALLNAP